MKAHYRTFSGRMSFELEGSPKEIFRSIAEVQEVFEADVHCQCCGKSDLVFRVRVVADNEFYELVCQNPDCMAALSFSQRKTGGRLYPRRYDQTGKLLPDRGWKVWQQSNQKGHRDI